MNWIRGQTIGHGSSATVSVAKANRSSEVFAAKSIELAKSDILQREQRILSSLRCDQIVEYMGCDVTNENGTFMYNLFMEYVAGGALSDMIRKQGGMDECTIGSYTRDILHGLDYLHLNGLVHCDIKGGNILVGAQGAKIGDLGCAKFGGDDIISIAGTPVFMAPEVARGEEQSFPADIWALGCTIVEMATGSPPWKDAKDPVSALYRIAVSDDVPEIPSCLSEQAKDFLGKCFVRDPKQRWTTSQLLKHSFVHSSKIQESPTSILDQDFWNSMEELDTPRNLITEECSTSVSAAERLQGMSSPVAPNWEVEEDWITIRSFSGNHSSTPTTTGSDRCASFNDETEEMELCEISGFRGVSFSNNCFTGSILEIRDNSCSSSSIISSCNSVQLCNSLDLKFEIQKEIIPLNQNLL